MLVSVKPSADFSSACALPKIAHTICLTHPLKIREVTLANASHNDDERGK
jgi:hypothetical protein